MVKHIEFKTKHTPKTKNYVNRDYGGTRGMGRYGSSSGVGGTGERVLNPPFLYALWNGAPTTWSGELAYWSMDDG